MRDEGAAITVRRFPALTSSVAEAGRFVASLAGYRSMEESDRAVLLTSELATNAVVHATTAFSVTVIRLRARLRIEVADAGRCPPWFLAAALGERGRGLSLVAARASAWGIDETPQGKVVWFEIQPRPAATTSPAPVLDPATDHDLDVLLRRLGGWNEGPDPSPTQDLHPSKH